MLTIGERLGSYRVVRAIGSGGMGMVLEGVHERIKSRAAIKLLHTQYSQLPELKERFLHEALATNIVQHPGIVSVFEHGQLPSGEAYIVMEYLDGESLRARIERRRRGERGNSEGLDRPTMLRLMRQLASAMAAAHEKQIIHRDLKPENIMVVKDPFAMGGERVKVLDFGIAKVRGLDRGNIQTGGLLGTPAYMAPESWAGAATVDEKVDVYALGVIIFEALTGELPFTDADLLNNPARWQQIHESEQPRTLRSVDPSAPIELEQLISKLLSKRPIERPEMAQVMAELDVLVGHNLRFRAGGFVRDGEFYIKRAGDEALFYGLLNGSHCHVLGPRQIGKTSLLHSVMQRLRNVRAPDLEQGVRCAVLDLLTLETSAGSSERFFFELVRELFRGLGLPGLPTDYWTDRLGQQVPQPAARFARLLAELPSILDNLQPVVVFIDHLEALDRLPALREGFLAAVSDAMNSSEGRLRPQSGRRDERGRAESLKVRYCLLGSVLPGDLMLDGKKSALEQSREVSLACFGETEARGLLPGLHTFGEASGKLLAMVMAWTSGQPHLTQRLCEALATRPPSDGAIQRLVDGVASEVVASGRQRAEPGFAFVEEGLRRAGGMRTELLTLYRALYEAEKGDRVNRRQGGEQAAEVTLSASHEPGLLRLVLWGLIRREGTRWRLSNRLFAEVFSSEWLRAEEAVRPVQALLAQWVGSGRAQSHLVVGVRLAPVLKWARQRSDLTTDEQHFLNLCLAEEQRLGRRKVALLLSVVAVLFASLVGAGWAWRDMRAAKHEVEQQQARTALALAQAENARQEAVHANDLTQTAMRTAEEARRAQEDAEDARAGALSEAGKQKGAAATANQRAKLAQERAQQAATAAKAASVSAQAANVRADEAQQSMGRTLTATSEALAAAEQKTGICEGERQRAESSVRSCQSTLASKESELQSTSDTLKTQAGQLATLHSQLAACKAEHKASTGAAREPGTEGTKPAANNPPETGTAPSKTEAPPSPPKAEGAAEPVKGP